MSQAACAGAHVDTPLPRTFVCTHPWDLHTLTRAQTHCPQQTGTSPAHRARHHYHTNVPHASACSRGHTHPCRRHPHASAHPHIPCAHVHKSLTPAHTFHAFPCGHNQGRGPAGLLGSAVPMATASVRPERCVPSLTAWQTLHQCPPMKHTLTHVRLWAKIHRTTCVCIYTRTYHVYTSSAQTHTHRELIVGHTSVQQSHELGIHTLVHSGKAVIAHICLNRDKMIAHVNPHTWCSHTHTHTPPARPLSHISSSVSQGGGPQRPRSWPTPTSTPPGSGFQETSWKSQCLGRRGWE